MTNSRWAILDMQEGWVIVSTYPDQDEARAVCDEMNAVATRYIVMYL